jgi:hypothetical protein
MNFSAFIPDFAFRVGDMKEGLQRAIHYIESFEDAGFTPDNPDNDFDQNGFTTLYYGSLESTQEIWNRQIVSSTDATRAAEEFATTLERFTERLNR